MAAPGRAARIKKELEQLSSDPPEGICVWQDPTDQDRFEATIAGPEESPFEGGVFKLEIKLGARYPFEPPAVRFQTRIYHPNIDESGRICLDSLKLGSSGSWRPSLNIRQILCQLRILIVEPGLADPLMKDIADVFKADREGYNKIALEWTLRYAKEDSASSKRQKSIADNAENKNQNLST